MSQRHDRVGSYEEGSEDKVRERELEEERLLQIEDDSDDSDEDDVKINHL